MPNPDALRLQREDRHSLNHGVSALVVPPCRAEQAPGAETVLTLLARIDEGLVRTMAVLRFGISSRRRPDWMCKNNSRVIQNRYCANAVGSKHFARRYGADQGRATFEFNLLAAERQSIH